MGRSPHFWPTSSFSPRGPNLPPARTVCLSFAPTGRAQLSASLCPHARSRLLTDARAPLLGLTILVMLVECHRRVGPTRQPRLQPAGLGTEIARGARAAPLRFRPPRARPPVLSIKVTPGGASLHRTSVDHWLSARPTSRCTVCWW
jgi:hypothetical protein